MSAAVSLSNVVPIKWTARGFVRAGVTFTVCGATITVAGPPTRPDLHQALLVELQRRVDVFAKFAPLDSQTPFPRVALPGVVVSRGSSCEACGDGLDIGRGGMCPLCTLALQRVLKNAGRI